MQNSTNYIVLTIITIFVIALHSVASPQTEATAERIRNRIETAGYPPLIEIQEVLIFASLTLPQFYEQRGFEPAWIDGKQALSQVQSLLNSIQNATTEGLNPLDYHLKEIQSIEEQLENDRYNSLPNRNRLLVDLELLCSDAFLIYGAHLLSGRVNPETIDSEWRAARRELDMVKVLNDALSSGEINLSLRNLLPKHQGYWQLRQALAYYRGLRRGIKWPEIPDGPRLQTGVKDKRLPLLVQRLSATGDLVSYSSDSILIYDERIESAVKAFQRRHGLEPVGYVGPQTLVALNVPLQDRIRQIEINLERWRWLPQELGKKHIIVNIADFHLYVYEKDSVVLEMKVVVGRDYRRTPVFTDTMTYLVFCPYWNVPAGIAVKDILPAVKKDSTYLTNKGIHVFQGWDADMIEVDPAIIDWSEVNSKSMMFHFRQDPGPINSLGHIKFMFPNKFNVYLHDTPAKELFDKQDRAFSSGCIRIERPLELAELLLSKNIGWNRNKIHSVIEKNVEQTVVLTEKIPVHLLYWTAWVDANGTVQFRKDVYGRDQKLYEALKEAPPELEEMDSR